MLFALSLDVGGQRPFCLLSPYLLFTVTIEEKSLMKKTSAKGQFESCFLSWWVCSCPSLHSGLGKALCWPLLDLRLVMLGAG